MSGKFGAGEGIRTLDPKLGKVVALEALYKHEISVGISVGQFQICAINGRSGRI
jgi:hypothetical protein